MLEEMVRETWAIHAGDENRGFLGIYMFDRHTTQPLAQSGFTIATFRNKKVAEAELAQLNAKELVPFPNAYSVRVKVTMQVV